MNITLIGVDGRLGLPIQDAEGCRHIFMDMQGPDSIPWPLVSEYRSEDQLVHQLAACLYDEVQMGRVQEHSTILLPDGQVFATYITGPWGLAISEPFLVKLKAPAERVRTERVVDTEAYG